MLKRKEIDVLCLQGEGTGVDFKREQYLFIKAADVDKAELLKDVMTMANANRNEPGYILIGVEELPNKLGKVVGISEVDVIDDANLHQFVNAKVNEPIPFVSYVLPSEVPERSCIQVLEIDVCRAKRPFYLRKNFGGLEATPTFHVRPSASLFSPRKVARHALHSLTLAE